MMAMRLCYRRDDCSRVPAAMGPTRPTFLAVPRPLSKHQSASQPLSRQCGDILLLPL